MSSEVSTCGRCGDRIRWVRYPSGKRAPLDVLPRDDGNVLVTGDYYQDGLPHARVLTHDELEQVRQERAGAVQTSLLEGDAEVVTIGEPLAAQVAGRLFYPHHATCNPGGRQ